MPSETDADEVPVDQTALDVVHDAEGRRYELRRSGEVVGLIDYRDHDGAVDMVHTETRRDLRGHGLAAVLVRGALDDVAERGATVIPSCWYVAQFVDNHPEYRRLLAD